MPFSIVFLCLLIILFIQSCDTKPKSEGLWNEICIIVSNEDKSLVYPYLANILDRTLYTPNKENEFKINWVDSNDFFKYKNYRNLIIVSLTSPSDSTGDVLIEKFKNLSSEKIFSLSDTFSKNQKLVVLNVFDSIQLSDVLKQNKQWLYDQFNNHIFATLYNSYMKYDLNHDLITKIKNDFYITINIDENYKLIKENKDFLWIGRGYPYRWIIFNISDQGNEKEDIFNVYRDVIHQNVEGLKITDTFKSIEYNSNYIKLSGLYEHEESDTGGPFFSYCYIDDRTNKKIFISGYVNNPGKNKNKLLKQLESIIINNKRMNHEL